MLTFSQGRVGPPSSGTAMSDHLGTGTMPSGSEEQAPRTVPTLSRHADRRLCRLLAIPTDRPLEPSEIESLLSGNTAAGRPIPGLVRRGRSRSLADALGLAAGQVPDAAAMKRFLSGQRVDGSPLPDRVQGGIARRLYAAYGVGQGQVPSAEQLQNLQQGRFADGSPARGKKFMRRLHRELSQVAYRDWTFAPDKSVSIAWALGSDAEREIILAAHHEAVDLTMADICEVVGRARRGDGGRKGAAPGACLQLRFTHFTARKTTADLGDVRPGDPHIHSQEILLNVVLPADGKPGRLDLGAVRSRIHEFGAIYHARLATALRRRGADVVFDVQRGCARMAAIPDSLIDRFSARTRTGRASLEAYLADNRLVLADLPHRRRVALLKQAVQGDPAQARRDDVANEIAWRETAADYPRHRFVEPSSSWRLPDDAERLDIATRAALMFIEEAKRAKRRVGVREAAARGLIASGLAGMKDVDLVAARVSGVATSNALLLTPEETIKAKRADGLAVMVQGGPVPVLSQAVARRAALEQAGLPARIVVQSDAEVAQATRLARLQRREAGLLGQDIFSVAVEAAQGPKQMGLAVGDLVVFGKTVNGTGVRGRVLAAGTPVVITAIDDQGLTVKNERGREAMVSRAALAAPDATAINMSYGYAVRGPVTIAETSVIAVTGGSRHLALGAPLRTSDVIVFGSAIEIAQAQRKIGNPDDIWDEVGKNFAPSPRPSSAAVAEQTRTNAEDVLLSGALRIERAIENRQDLSSFAESDSGGAVGQMISLVAGLADSLRARRQTTASLGAGRDRDLEPRGAEGSSHAQKAQLSRRHSEASASAVENVEPAERLSELGPSLSSVATERAVLQPASTPLARRMPEASGDEDQAPKPYHAALRAEAERINEEGERLRNVSDRQVEAVAASLVDRGRAEEVLSLGNRVTNLLASIGRRFQRVRSRAKRVMTADRMALRTGVSLEHAKESEPSRQGTPADHGGPRRAQSIATGDLGLQQSGVDRVGMVAASGALSSMAVEPDVAATSAGPKVPARGGDDTAPRDAVADAPRKRSVAPRGEPSRPKVSPRSKAPAAPAAVKTALADARNVSPKQPAPKAKIQSPINAQNQNDGGSAEKSTALQGTRRGKPPRRHPRSRRASRKDTGRG